MILYGFLMVIHVLASIALIIAVLLQAGRGGGLAGTFGGGATQSMFGGRGAGDFLTKSTQILGATFMATSLSLFLLSGVLKGGSSDDAVLEKFRDRGTGAPVPGTPGSVPGALPPISGAPLGTTPAPGSLPETSPAGSASGSSTPPAGSSPEAAPESGEGTTQSPATGP
jgi:preprotein translocase subunit SecG